MCRAELRAACSFTNLQASKTSMLVVNGRWLLAGGRWNHVAYLLNYL